MIAFLLGEASQIRSTYIEWLLIHESLPFMNIGRFCYIQEVYPLFVKSLFLIDVPLWFKLKQKVVEHFLAPQVRHKVSCV